MFGDTDALSLQSVVCIDVSFCENNRKCLKEINAYHVGGKAINNCALQTSKHPRACGNRVLCGGGREKMVRI